MPRKGKYNDAEIIAKWLKAKREDPTLTNNEFFKKEGIPVPYGQKRLGPFMVSAWSAVRQIAVDKIAKDAGLDLGKEMAELFKANKKVLLKGLEGVVKTQKGNPKHASKDFLQALRAVRVGTQGLVSATALLTGGEPLKEEDDVEEILELVDPSKVKGLKRGKVRKGASKKKSR